MTLPRKILGTALAAATALGACATGLLAAPSQAITNGLTGVESQAPWSVMLRKSGTPWCSGSLVAPTLVLSAKHCTEGTTATAYTVYSANGALRSVTAKVEHSSLDAVLLRLSSAIDARTLPLAPTAGTVDGFVNRGVTFFGWGKTSPNGSMSSVARKTPDGAFKGTSPCNSFFGTAGSTACYLKTSSTDGVTVQGGDSGGSWVGWEGGAWVQLAVLKGVSGSQSGGVSAAALRSWVVANSGGDVLAARSGTIVRDASNGTSWYVDGTGFRRWIPDGRTYLCLVGQNVAVTNTTGARAATIPDRVGTHMSCQRDSLGVNQVLHRGDYLRSSDGRYTLHLQASDGNLVLYNAAGRAVWATNRSNGNILVLQGDSNLVDYTSSGSPLWASNTVNRGAARFVVQSDGNMVMYTAGGGVVWASNTVGR